MDQVIKKIFEDTLNENLINIILSNSTDKEKSAKIKLRPVMLKGILYYQASEYIGDKVYHANYQINELLGKLPDWFEGLFRQAEILTNQGKVTLLISKKGKVTVINKLKNKKTEDGDSADMNPTSEQLVDYQHNRTKNYILKEGEALPFLVDLGVMSEDGHIVKSKSDKFRQINRFLEYIEDILPYLQKDKELTILDFGCGKSYLTFAMYYYLRVLKGYRINVIGLDLKTDVIKKCNELGGKYGYEHLHFLEGDIASYEGISSVDMVVTLHACDTATDYALYKAVTWGAQVILSVPCCQHELNNQIQSEVLKPILKYGLVKERMAALITDALRAELLETKGYRAQLLEFIEMEHTPKNILIRAVKRSAPTQGAKTEQLQNCMDFLNVTPCLLNLFKDEE
jgi:SAM-dependent methyltransferase